MNRDATAPARAADGVPASVFAFLDEFEAMPRTRLVAQLIGRDPVPRKLRSRYVEASGDVAVLDVLSHLGACWWSRRAGATGDDVEHIVLGPAGVFSVLIRHHPGGSVWIDGRIILVDGERRPDIRDAESCGVRVTQLMSDALGSRVDVTPCLVLVGHRNLTVAKPPRRVAVTTLRDIRTWVRSLRKVLSDAEVEALRGAVARHPELHPLVSLDAPTVEPLELFRRVQTEVGQARHIRLTWITASLVLFWLIAVVTIGGMTTSVLVR